MIITLKGANFANSNIGTLDSYSIRFIGSGVTNSNTSVYRESNTGYTTTITLGTGYELNGSITVTMGGTDITSTAVSGYTITISKVTGNVVITVPTKNTATGEEDLPVDLYTITWEAGGINVATGNNDDGASAVSSRRRSTDFIPVEYGYATMADGATTDIHVIYFDADKNYLAPNGYETNNDVIYRTYTLSNVSTNIHAYKPDNAVYMRIVSRTADTAQDALWKPLSTAYIDHFDPNNITWEAGGIGVASGVNTAAGAAEETTRRRTITYIPVKYKNATLSGKVDAHIVFYDSTMTYVGTTMTNGTYSFYTLSSGETKNLCEQAPENTAYYRILARTADAAQDAYWSFSQ